MHFSPCRGPGRAWINTTKKGPAAAKSDARPGFPPRLAFVCVTFNLLLVCATATLLLLALSLALRVNLHTITDLRVPFSPHEDDAFPIHLIRRISNTQHYRQ